eukprot:1668503-Lingulodinium_polyedra.AAC.1
MTDGGGVVIGTIPKPTICIRRQMKERSPQDDTALKKCIGLRTSKACYSFWQGGDSINTDAPLGNQVCCQTNECIPEVVTALQNCLKETGSVQFLSDCYSSDDAGRQYSRFSPHE